MRIVILNALKRFCITLQTIIRALFPLRGGLYAAKGNVVKPAVLFPEGYTQVLPEHVPSYLANLDAAVNQRHELALFFKGCLMPAAPFLLFRLKREGFSRCRIAVLPDGIALDAQR